MKISCYLLRNWKKYKSTSSSIVIYNTSSSTHKHMCVGPSTSTLRNYEDTDLKNKQTKKTWLFLFQLLLFNQQKFLDMAEDLEIPPRSFLWLLTGFIYCKYMCTVLRELYSPKKYGGEGYQKKSHCWYRGKKLNVL